jgi:hypothetical protein
MQKIHKCSLKDPLVSPNGNNKGVGSEATSEILKAKLAELEV